MSRRICFVLGEYFGHCKGGAELQAYFVATEMLKRQHEVHYVYFGGAGKNGAAERRECDDGIVLHALTRHDFGRFGRLPMLGREEFDAVLREIDPDLVYQRSRTAFTGLAARYAGMNGKGFVWGTSSIADCARRSLADLRIDRAAVFANTLSYHWAVYGMKRADRIVVQTEEQERLLRRDFGLRGLIIPNSHPVAPAPPEKPEPPVVAWVANAKRWKRPGLFLDLAAACQDLEATFVMAGRMSSRRDAAALLARAASMPNVSYLGELSLEAVNDLLARASVFVNTSEPREGFPNIYIQAWMRRVPTVTMSCDPDGVIATEGLGFHSLSFDRLVRDVRTIILNPGLRQERGSRARQYALEHHDIEKISEHYVSLFDDVLERRR